MTRIRRAGRFWPTAKVAMLPRPDPRTAAWIAAFRVNQSERRIDSRGREWWLTLAGFYALEEQ